MGRFVPSDKKDKSYNFECICYPENMVDDWRDSIADIVQLPFCYILHDKDVDSSSNQRKSHVHLMLHKDNPTTVNNIIRIANKLSKDGRICCPKCMIIDNIRGAYDYQIHDTPSCRKAGKYLYDKSERIEGNGFDIGFLEQTSVEELNKAFDEIMAFIKDNHIIYFCDVSDFCYSQSDRLHTFRNCLKVNSGLFYRECSSQYKKWSGLYNKGGDNNG